MSEPADTGRIRAITIDDKSIVRWSPEVAHERDVAIFDLLEDNRFVLQGRFAGPYSVHLSLRDATLVLAVSQVDGTEEAEIGVPVRSMRKVIKDYFLICDSYFQAIKGAPPSRIEAIDMARRGLHNDGSELLVELLRDKVDLDHNTARRLFTLICVLHIRG